VEVQRAIHRELYNVSIYLSIVTLQIAFEWTVEKCSNGRRSSPQVLSSFGYPLALIVGAHDGGRSESWKFNRMVEIGVHTASEKRL